jgi:hypothetical protein
MSRTVNPPRPLVSTDGRADARGSITVSTSVARAVLAALAGLTVHPWPGVEHGENRPTASLSDALEAVPEAPGAIIAAVDALEAAGIFESDGSSNFWRPNVGTLEAGTRYRWMPWGTGERQVVIHFRGDDAVISWASAAPSRFIGRIIAWASPRSAAVAPMAGNSGPVRSL